MPATTHAAALAPELFTAKAGDVASTPVGGGGRRVIGSDHNNPSRVPRRPAYAPELSRKITATVPTVEIQILFDVLAADFGLILQTSINNEFTGKWTSP